MNNKIPYYRIYPGIFEIIENPCNLILMTEMAYDLQPGVNSRGFESWHKKYKNDAVSRYRHFMRSVFKLFPARNAVLVGLDSIMRDYCERSLSQVGEFLDMIGVSYTELNLPSHSRLPVDRPINHRIMSHISSINSLARKDTTVIVVADQDNVEDASGFRPWASFYEARVEVMKLTLNKEGEIEFEKPI